MKTFKCLCDDTMQMECDDAKRATLAKDIQCKMQIKPTLSEAVRDRDGLWCGALMLTLDMYDVEKVLRKFNEMRDD